MAPTSAEALAAHLAPALTANPHRPGSVERRLGVPHTVPLSQGSTR